MEIKKVAEDILRNQEDHASKQFDNVTGALKDGACTVVDLGAGLVKGLFSLASRNLDKIASTATNAISKDMDTVKAARDQMATDAKINAEVERRLAQRNLPTVVDNAGKPV
jgi:hypothetical protein